MGHTAYWPHYFAYYSLLDTTFIEARDTPHIALMTAVVQLLQTGMPPSGQDTTLLFVTSSTFSKDQHPGHFIATEDLPTSSVSPSPTSPLYSLPSVSFTHWEAFDQWRSQELREADETVETSTSISTRISEDPEQGPLLDAASEDEHQPELLTLGVITQHIYQGNQLLYLILYFYLGILNKM